MKWSEVERLVRDLEFRELDVLVAEKVMGTKGIIWQDRIASEHVRQPTIGYEYDPGKFVPVGTNRDGFYQTRLPYYTMSIADAWLLVEKLCPAEDEFRIRRFHNQDWACTFQYFDGGGDDGIANTAPLAICLAALKTVIRQ